VTKIFLSQQFFLSQKFFVTTILSHFCHTLVTLLSHFCLAKGDALSDGDALSNGDALSDGDALSIQTMAWLASAEPKYRAVEMHFLKIQTLAWLGCPSRLCLASEQWRCTF
jgi:hypothetical protein